MLKMQVFSGFGCRSWVSKYILDHGSINNSVMLTSMNFACLHQSAVKPRILVSNNDQTVKFFDVAIYGTKAVDDYEPRLLDSGQLHLDVLVNHGACHASPPPFRNLFRADSCVRQLLFHSLHLS